jgi:hypothetical protein
MDLKELRGVEPCPGPELGGVGARQGKICTGQGGGGYLNECTSSEFLERAKIAELADMGLPSVWIRVAENIGYNNFLLFWRILDTAAELREIRRSENESMIAVQLRRYTSFTRYQRNRWIEGMAGRGLPTAAIQEAVTTQLGEKLDRSHIRRLAKPGRTQK